MGQNQYIIRKHKQSIYELKVSDRLNDIIREEIYTIKKTSKTPDKKTIHKNKLSINEKIEFYENDSLSDNLDNNEIEIETQNITEFMDLIYTKNINTQLKLKANKSVYETNFDLRNLINYELLDNNIENSENYNVIAVEIMKNSKESEIINNEYNEINNNNNLQKSVDNNLDYNLTEKIMDYREIQNDFFKNWEYDNENKEISENKYKKNNNDGLIKRTISNKKEIVGIERCVSELISEEKEIKTNENIESFKNNINKTNENQ